MAIRAVLFDLFDTLVDLSMDGLPVIDVRGQRWPSSAGALHAQVSEHAPCSLEDFVDEMVASDRELRSDRIEQGRELPTLERFEHLMTRLGLSVPDLPRRLTETHMALLRGQVSAVAHHPEVLGGLRERFRLGVCSNFTHSETALRVLEDAALRWSFDAVTVSDVVGFRKPRPEIFQSALRALGISPDEGVHVGDSLKADVAGAASVGLRTVWITRRIGDVAEALAEHEGPAPDATIDDLAELPGLLERW